jgi:Zn-dependent protease
LFRDIDPVDLMIRVPVILLALTVHEFCHAYFALRMGDPTAYRLGRCSLNPLRHLEPLGTICMLFGPIGWAKPVPINSLNFDDPRKGDLIATAAGPLSNLAQALVFTLLLKFAWSWTPPAGQQWKNVSTIALTFCWYGVYLNIGMTLFNLLPLYPLDGFHIVASLQPADKEARFRDMAPFGPFAILGLIALGRFTHVDLLGSIIDPVFNFLAHTLAGIPSA